MPDKTQAHAVTLDVGNWIRRAIDLVYPRNCPFCFTPLTERERGIVCSGCLATARFIEPPFCEQCAAPFHGVVTNTFVCGYCRDLRFSFSRTICACRAEGIVRDCIHRFKYNRELYFGTHLSDWLIAAARRMVDWERVDAIVPVPLHPRKKRERQFNQAEHLARRLSACFGVPSMPGKLRRVKDTITQTALDAEDRARNLRDAFTVRDGGVFEGKRIVLVDDVFTTGATMDSCAKVLRSTGAADVVALAVARGV